MQPRGCAVTERGVEWPRPNVQLIARQDYPTAPMHHHLDSRPGPDCPLLVMLVADPTGWAEV